MEGKGSSDVQSHSTEIQSSRQIQEENSVPLDDRQSQGNESYTVDAGLVPLKTMPYSPPKSPLAPVYAKVHQDYVSIDTLMHYNLPYEVDEVCSYPFLQAPGFAYFS